MAKAKGKAKSGKKPTPPEKLDIKAVRALGPLLAHPAVRAIGQVGKVGDEPPLLALSAATLAAGLLRRDRRLSRAGAGMLAAHLIAIGIKTLGKNNIDRTRPPRVLKNGRYRMEPGHSHKKALRSFPSGHTAGAVAVARAVAREYPEHRAAAYAAAAAIGALQVARRAHFPGDVLAGTLVGLASEGLGHALLRPVEEAAAERLPAAPL